MTLIRYDLILYFISIFSICIRPCHASLPTIAIYGMVAGGALFIVLMALLIAFFVSRCRCRRKDDGDVEKGNKSKATKSKTKPTKVTTKDNKKPKGKKGFLAVKPAKKSTKNGEKGNEKKGVAGTGTKAGVKNDKLSIKNKKKEEKLKKKQMKKEAKEKQKLEKEKAKQAKAKGKNNDKKNAKKGDKNNKDSKGTNKNKDKWKGAVSKINSFRNGNDVSPMKSPTKAKIAWTKTLDAAKKPPRWN